MSFFIEISIAISLFLLQRVGNPDYDNDLRIFLPRKLCLRRQKITDTVKHFDFETIFMFTYSNQLSKTLSFTGALLNQLINKKWHHQAETQLFHSHALQLLIANWFLNELKRIIFYGNNVTISWCSLASTFEEGRRAFQGCS